MTQIVPGHIRRGICDLTHLDLLAQNNCFSFMFMLIDLAFRVCGYAATCLIPLLLWLSASRVVGLGGRRNLTGNGTHKPSLRDIRACVTCNAGSKTHMGKNLWLSTASTFGDDIPASRCRKKGKKWTNNFHHFFKCRPPSLLPQVRKGKAKCMAQCYKFPSPFHPL